MRWLANPNRSFPKLLFEFLNRGELGQRCCFLSNRGSSPSAEEFFATRMNDFFSRAQRGVESAQELRGAFYSRWCLDQTRSHCIGFNRGCRRRRNIGQFFQKARRGKEPVGFARSSIPRREAENLRIGLRRKVPGHRGIDQYGTRRRNHGVGGNTRLCALRPHYDSAARPNRAENNIQGRDCGIVIVRNHHSRSSRDDSPSEFPNRISRQPSLNGGIGDRKRWHGAARGYETLFEKHTRESSSQFGLGSATNRDPLPRSCCGARKRFFHLDQSQLRIGHSRGAVCP